MFKNTVKKFTFIILILFSTSIFANFIKIAAAQMVIQQESFDQFKAKLTQMTLDAKSKGAEIIVFPEDNAVNLVEDMDWNKQTILELGKYYDKIKDFISQLAKANNMIIVGGTTVRVIDDNITNTILIGLPDGKVIQEEKTYLTPEEKNFGYTSSNGNIVVLKYKGISIAVIICYTSEFPDVSQKLSTVNPDIILIPSYTNDLYGLERVQTAAKMLSIQNFAYGMVVGMASGLDKKDSYKREGVAQTLFTSPQQKEFPLDYLKKGVFNKEQVLVQELDISKLHNARKNYDAFPNKEIMIDLINIKRIKV